MLADRVVTELGQLGRFHLASYLLLAPVATGATLYGLTYVFLAADLPYR